MDDTALFRSPKNFVTAVILSSVLGPLGIHQFYLGRFWEGMIDLLLTVGWIYSLIQSQYLYFGILLALDLLHGFVVTIRLFTGNMRDGEGKFIMYPGQKLKQQI